MRNYRRNSDETLRKLQRQILTKDTAAVEPYIHYLYRTGQISIPLEVSGLPHRTEAYLREMLDVSTWLVQAGYPDAVIRYCGLDLNQQNYVKRIFLESTSGPEGRRIVEYHLGDRVWIYALRSWLETEIARIQDRPLLEEERAVISALEKPISAIIRSRSGFERAVRDPPRPPRPWYYVAFEEEVPDTLPYHWDAQLIVPVDPLGILIVN